MASGYPDFEGDKSKLFTVADWAAVEATDKNILLAATEVTTGTYTFATYTVPAGLTLYITHASMVIYAKDAGDRDYNQMCELDVRDYSALTTPAIAGGNGGAIIPLNKPISIPAGSIFRIVAWNRSDHTCYVAASAHGYEV